MAWRGNMATGVGHEGRNESAKVGGGRRLKNIVKKKEGLIKGKEE
jgi:hypothetical protein